MLRVVTSGSSFKESSIEFNINEFPVSVRLADTKLVLPDGRDNFREISSGPALVIDDIVFTIHIVWSVNEEGRTTDDSGLGFYVTGNHTRDIMMKMNVALLNVDGSRTRRVDLDLERLAVGGKAGVSQIFSCGAAPPLIKTSVVLDPRTGWIPNNTLTLVCTISMPSNMAPTLERPDADLDISRDLGTLLFSEALSDLTINVENTRLHAHSQILAARSPVFCQLLEDTPMKSDRTKEVSFNDVGVDTMEHFLRFVYTGSVVPVALVTDDSASDLARAGQKFEVPALVEACKRGLGFRSEEEIVEDTGYQLAYFNRQATDESRYSRRTSSKLSTRSCPLERRDLSQCSTRSSTEQRSTAGLDFNSLGCAPKVISNGPGEYPEFKSSRKLRSLQELLGDDDADDAEVGCSGTRMDGITRAESCMESIGRQMGVGPQVKPWAHI